MSRFLLLSEDGSSLGLAMRLQAESHSVKMWIRDPLFKDVGRGLIDNANSYEFGQIIIPECIGFGILCDVWRDSGVPVFGGSSFADCIEEDRELAEEVMYEAGIETPKSKRATSWAEAKKLVQQFSSKGDAGKVVIKPEGKLSGIVPSYVASSVEDGLSMLEVAEQQAGSTEPELVIQEFIEGIAVSTEGWFNGFEWIEGMFNRTIENKKTLNDDLGPSEGCAGNVVYPVSSKDPIVKETLLKLTVYLREKSYIGPFDINCVVNKEGIYALEFTPRFGYDAFPTLLYTLCDFDFGSFVDSVSKHALDGQSLREGFGAGVRLNIPSGDGHGTTKVRGLEGEECFYPYHLCCNKDILESTQDGSMLGVVTGFGDSIGEAFARAYLVCSKIQAKDLQYRTDLTETCLKDYRELEGLLNDDDDKGWIGVDLDGTLASYSTWSEDIGEPVAKMVQRVKGWLSNGTDVRIFTARGSIGSDRYEQLIKVYEWTKKYLGEPLEVTYKKDPYMLKLYDDRARQVEKGTGVLV